MPVRCFTGITPPIVQRKQLIEDDEDERQRPKRRDNTLLDDDLIEAFCSLVRRGLTLDSVCHYLGIHATTFWDWRVRGERYLLGGDAPRHDRIYGQFVTNVRKALADLELTLLDELRDNQQDKHIWKRNMTILERRNRRGWGREDIGGGQEDQYEADEQFL